VGATGEELRHLYRQAAIYWHATGLHEDENRHPDRFEHFGITTVEAMSAGAVPVVIGAGGQREVVRDGVDGYWFTDLDGLVARTRELIDNPDRRALMAGSARQAAQRFSVDAFADAVVEEVTALSSPSRD
jgi:glycosyltransferase involved in cell wall biosynthesis